MRELHARRLTLKEAKFVWQTNVGAPLYAYFENLPASRDYADGFFQLDRSCSSMNEALDRVWGKVQGDFKYYAIYDRV